MAGEGAKTPNEEEIYRMEKQKLGLTEKQHKAFEWIDGFITRNGFSPSIDDIKRGLSLNSRGAAMGLVMQLEERGWVCRSTGARSIAVVK